MQYSGTKSCQRLAMIIMSTIQDLNLKLVGHFLKLTFMIFISFCHTVYYELKDMEFKPKLKTSLQSWKKRWEKVVLHSVRIYFQSQKWFYMTNNICDVLILMKDFDSFIYIILLYIWFYILWICMSYVFVALIFLFIFHRSLLRYACQFRIHFYINVFTFHLKC